MHAYNKKSRWATHVRAQQKEISSWKPILNPHLDLEQTKRRKSEKTFINM